MTRLVIKIGSNILTNARGELSTAAMRRLVDQIANLHKTGAAVTVVTSGAVAAARARFPDLQRRHDVPAKQMLAAIGQVRLMHVYSRLFSRHGIAVAQALLARSDLDTRQRYLNARSTLLGLIEHRVVPIINENDVVVADEIKFGDNDTLSAVVALLLDADLLLILTDIEGLYTADPRRDRAAILIREVPALTPAIERLAGGSGSTHGTGGMVTKLRAARLATDVGIPMIIADGRLPEGVQLAVGGQIGTRFHAREGGLDARRRWLRAHLGGKGAIVVDDGAARALRRQGRSLLAAGVVEVQGRFDRGEPVEIRDRCAGVVGFGLSNYAAADLQRIQGSHSGAIVALLGYQHGDEVIHRDNMVVLPADAESLQEAAR
jgi:glutamate 5-kinase